MSGLVARRRPVVCGPTLLGGVAPGNGWDWPSPVLSTQEEYDELIARASPDPFPPVDFTTHVVIGAYVHIAATCDVDGDSTGIRDDGLYDGTSLVVRMAWGDGMCESVCDDARQFLVLYEVPRPIDSASVCIEYEMGCDQD